MLGVEWENLHVAGAFVVGALLGALGTIRVMRAVLQTYERFSRRDKHSPSKEDDQ